MQDKNIIAIAHPGQNEPRNLGKQSPYDELRVHQSRWKHYHLLPFVLSISGLWLTRFFSTFRVDISFTLLPDEMLKMTSCWIQPISRIHLFWISFWTRFRLSIFRSIFICIEIDASVFLAVWAAAVATDYFVAAWARRDGFNVIIWKVFDFFFPLLKHLFLMVSAVSIREKKMFLIKFPNPRIVRGYTNNMKT